MKLLTSEELDALTDMSSNGVVLQGRDVARLLWQARMALEMREALKAIAEGRGYARYEEPYEVRAARECLAKWGASDA